MSAGKVDVLAVMENCAREYYESRVELREARAAVADLIEAASNMNCACTLKERDSGHRVGCSMPYLSAALARIGGDA